jgi:hypothetical protein
MKIKVISVVRDADHAFYVNNIETHQEWCENQNYDYVLHKNEDCENCTPSWRNFKTLAKEVYSANTSDVIIFLDASVMIMESSVEFPILGEMKSEGIWINSHGNEIFFDVVAVKVTDLIKRAMLFAEKFFLTSRTDAPFALRLISTVFDHTVHLKPRKTTCSSWYTRRISDVEVKAITEKRSSSGITSKIEGLYAFNSPEFIYKPGDFAVNLGIDKYLAKHYSEDFMMFKSEYHKVKEESSKIIEEFENGTTQNSQ